MASPAPLRVPKTAEVLAARLRGQIIRGELREGDVLPNENELMETLAVSRHVLREAFRILESERLLTVRRGARGGALVLAPDPGVAGRHVGILLQVRGTSLREVQRARLALEPTAVRWLSESTDVAGPVATLREYNDRTAAAVGDPVAFSGRTFEFHRKVVELAGNSALTVLMDLLADVIQLHITVRQTDPGADDGERIRTNKLSVKANEKMLRLVESGRADAAEAYWREHLTAVLHHLTDADGPVTVVDLFS
jgi:GntR family transcriptional regulator, transcriptional repressor for pyruvate dehydrogenase complex